MVDGAQAGTQYGMGERVAQALAAHALMEATGAHALLSPVLLGPEHAKVDSEAFIKDTLKTHLFGLW